MSEPRTEAGRQLVDALVGLGVDNDDGEAAHDILAIEREAVAAERERLRAAVEALLQIDSVRLDSVDLRRDIDHSPLLVRAAVLALLSEDPD